MHYLNRILPLLDPNKPMHMYEEADFNGVLEQLWNIYHFSDSTLEHYRNLIWIVYKAGFESGLYPDNIFWGEVYDPSEHTDTENEEHRVRIRTRLRKSLLYGKQTFSRLFQPSLFYDIACHPSNRNLCTETAKNAYALHW